MLRGWETPKERSGMFYWGQGMAWRSGIASWGGVRLMPPEMLHFWKCPSILLQDILESHHQPLSASKLQIVISKVT